MEYVFTENNDINQFNAKEAEGGSSYLAAPREEGLN